MRTKSSPGPWSVSDDQWGLNVLKSNGHLVVALDQSPDNNNITAKDRANAQLIAAAPQLRDALIAILTDKNINLSDAKRIAASALHVTGDA